MPDLPQTIIETLQGAFTSVHIGQDVPQSITSNFVFFQRQGDVQDDSLQYPPVSMAVLFDFECVSTSIASCRTLTEELKGYLSTINLNSIGYDIDNETSRLVHCFEVEDHDDSYIPHLVQQDAKLHIGSFRVTAHLGDIIQLT